MAKRYTPPGSYVPAMQAASPIRPEHIPGVRRKLRSMGYKVSLKGPMTDRLLRAWRNYRASVHGGSHKTVDQWNHHNRMASDSSISGVTRERMRGQHVGIDPVKAAGKRTKTHAKAKAAAQGLGAGAGGQGTNFPGVPAAPDGGSDGVVPHSMADKLAGLQVDPQIHELLTQLAQGRRDEGQAQHDIGHWYGQVTDAQNTARQRDTEASQGAKRGVQDAISGIVQSLGGSRGAGVVGAAGVNDLAALAEQGSSQDRYNADLAPLLTQEAAGAHSRETALASQTRSGRESQLVGLRGQRGQLQSQALMQIMQQNFGNKLALNNAALAAASLGLDADKTQAMLSQYGLSNQMNQAKLRAMQQANRTSAGHPNWGALNPVDRQSLIDNAIKTASGQLPAGVWDPSAVMNAALATLRAGGYGSARKGSYVRRGGRVPSRANQQAILGLLQQRMQYYHGQHQQTPNQ